MQYQPREIEQKWQKIWQERHTGYALPTGEGKKYYCLDMFPYPSGSGLHVGHWRGYILSDVYARVKWHEGYNVLHPMGWDAFGLPAENDAIKKQIHPSISTASNIATFKKQLEDTGALYDWSKEINTTDSQYYKWTQWIFLQMYKAGLAYQADMPINWCPSCLTGLANEEVVNNACERCGTAVQLKNIKQWILKITDYAQKLLEGLENLEWPEKVKTMQRNWIGKSYGAHIVFQLENLSNAVKIPIFTTRPDTLYGVTFLAMAPDHELVLQITTPDRKEDIQEFQKKLAFIKKNTHTQDLATHAGVFTGSYVLHPLTQEKIPVLLAPYVLKDYATGVVMGVPAHDARDFAFAQAHGLPIKQVIDHANVPKDTSGILTSVYEGEGVLINSGPFNGQLIAEASETILKYLEQTQKAERKVTYSLRDWIFSRQRYWGEPIPIIHCAQCGPQPVPEDQLPVTLPDVKNYMPTGTGQSPLAAIDWWVNTRCPQCEGPAKRETNTMPQWAGSCWYFLRYPDAHRTDVAFDPASMKYWLPVDLYVGGIEHAILHLLYARFYVKVLYDLGYLSFDEPFLKLFNQGMVTKYSEKSGHVEKMSKSKGNVVNPDDIVKEYGSDALRLYILFMGPPELDSEWNNSGLEGCKRFLYRFWGFITDPKHRLASNQKEQVHITKRVHKLLKDVHERLEHFKPNTVVSAVMEWLNDAIRDNMQLSDDSLEKILVTLSVLAPHIASELMQKILNKELWDCKWPSYDPDLARTEEITIPVQVNGKLRGTITVSIDTEQKEIESRAQQEIEQWLNNAEIIKIVYVPQRLINFVIDKKVNNV